MGDSASLTLWLTISAGAAAVAWYASWKRSEVGAGLVVAYITVFWVFHWLGAGIYLLPWYSGHPLQVIEAGSRLSAFAMVGFALGSAVIAPLLMRLFALGKAQATARSDGQRLATVYMVIGLLCYSSLTTVGRVPTLGALLTVGWNFLVVGLGLVCWAAWQERKFRSLSWWLAVTLTLPLFTLVMQGFVSYGMGALLVVVTLFAGFVRPRWKVAIVTVLLSYMWLSFYVSYMRDRADIRDVVWGGESLGKRIEEVYHTVSNFEWFDPFDSEHLGRIDLRLNQNYLVGAAEQYLTSGRQQYALGETLWEAVVSIIPRTIWPDKPVAAGSGELVSQYTGLRFAPGTSVGIGQVMEFYVNFGTAGIVLGFLVIGLVVRLVDSVAGQRLTAGDWRGFTLWYLPGLSLLQVGGSLVEVTGSAGASIAMALLVNTFLLPRGRKRKSLLVPARPDPSRSAGPARQPAGAASEEGIGQAGR